MFHCALVSGLTKPKPGTLRVLPKFVAGPMPLAIWPPILTPADEAKAEIVLAQRARRAAKRVDIAADRAAIADKALIEVLPVIQLSVAHHDPDPEMAPGLVDAGGADQFGPGRFSAG